LFITFVFLLLIVGNLRANLDGSCTLKRGYLAAATEQIFDEAVEYSVEGDTQALSLLVASELVWTTGRTKVYVESWSFLSGKVKVRLAGTTMTFWTNSEAVDCD